MSYKEGTFLSLLIQKKSSVLQVRENSNVNIDAGLIEVDRQIRQCLKGGDLVTGEGVTKSSQESNIKVGTAKINDMCNDG